MSRLIVILLISCVLAYHNHETQETEQKSEWRGVKSERRVERQTYLFPEIDDILIFCTFGNMILCSPRLVLPHIGLYFR